MASSRLQKSTKNVRYLNLLLENMCAAQAHELKSSTPVELMARVTAQAD